MPEPWGLDGGVVPAWLYLEAGVVVQGADQQDRALVGGEAVSELADMADKPVGGVQRRGGAGLGVGGGGGLGGVERGFCLEGGGGVGPGGQPVGARDPVAP